MILNVTQKSQKFAESSLLKVGSLLRNLLALCFTIVLLKASF